MRPFPAPRQTIARLLDDLRVGRTSCVEVLESCLDRIEEREPELRAFVVIDREGARARARALDAERAEGRSVGPLHGVPVGIKDIIDVKGLPTAAGSELWAERVARADAEVVARLREAGAVIVGKTVTTAYAWIDPPPTTNPWHPERTPGGSSSGSAAAVGAGLLLGALGSQTGGSITRPAAYCGAAGLKPTYGRLPGEGILPLAPSLDHPGPIAPTAADLSALWSALRPDDPPAEPPGPGRAPRLGRLAGLFRDQAEPEALESLERALDAFRAAGAEVSDPPLPAAFKNVLLQHRTILAAEAASEHAARRGIVPDDYPGRINALILEGLAVRASAYIFARNHRRTLQAEILSAFEGCDALITPAAPSVAPDRSTTGDPAFNSPWSYAGLPTVSFPVALSDDRLPLAVQLVGRPGGESRLLGLAIWCEQALRMADG